MFHVSSKILLLLLSYFSIDFFRGALGQGLFILPIMKPNLLLNRTSFFDLSQSEFNLNSFGP